MRYLILCFSLLLIACNDHSNKKVRKPVSISTSEVKTQEPRVTFEKISFYSKDSLPITADVYKVDEKVPTFLLCHQAGYSRGEYKKTALELAKLGISSMAIDQRSGNGVNGIINETNLVAKERNLPTNYLDAKPDIEAAIDYLYEKNGKQPILLVGSSYSATLALIIGNKNYKVKAIAAFSPGEYFKSIDVKSTIKEISKPTFVTSSKKESEALKELISLINPTIITHYIPNEEGIHGSRALWDTTVGSEDYWDAFKLFIQKKV